MWLGGHGPKPDARDTRTRWCVCTKRRSDEARRRPAAQFAGPDTLVVILECSLTVAERNLVAMGEHQRLREARLFFQYALEDQFRAIVEQALGRRTLAFVSGIDTQRDVAMEVFTLEPGGEGAPRRSHNASRTESRRPGRAC